MDASAARRLALGLVLAILAPLGSTLAQTAPTPANPPHTNPPPFTFIAIGCLPYARLHQSTESYGRVLSEISRHQPAFAIHLGDIMGSEELCTDELLLRRLREFDSVSPALVFTPGDNEWTDVHRSGKFQPLERLAKIRELFFPDDRSRGVHPLPLTTQRHSPEFPKFVENARWSRGGVMFATVHVVGSANNYQPTVAGALEEWKERDLANDAWLRETFAEARTHAAPGLALFCQANPFTGSPGFKRFLTTLANEARAFAKPVLFVHADEHRFRLEQGIRPQPDAPLVPNVTRLETFGASDFHGALVVVDPASAEVFLPAPWIVPGNPPPRLPPQPPPPSVTTPPPASRAKAR